MVDLFAVHMPHAIDKPLIATLHSGYIGQGPVVAEFEKKLGDWIGFKNVVTTCSGTTALQLALRVSRIGQANGGFCSDEVITTPMTCTATNMPILAAGAVPVWADVHAQHGLIDELDVERKINKNTKAIICVDWGGTPCNLSVLRQISDYYGIQLIEDAAHALGATDWGTPNKIGNQTADFTIFSFQAIKHITTVDGGALFIKDGDLYKRARLERWYGIDRDTDRKDFRCESDIADWGLKWHMNDVNATIGIEQLNYIDGIISEHKQNARWYWENIDRERFVPAFEESALTHSSFWLFTLLLENASDRGWFMDHAKKWGVQVSQVHARNDTHTAFRVFKQGMLPGVQKFSDRMVCIPVHWKLNQSDKDKVLSMLHSYKVLDSVGT